MSFLHVNTLLHKIRTWFVFWLLLKGPMLLRYIENNGDFIFQDLVSFLKFISPPCVE